MSTRASVITVVLLVLLSGAGAVVAWEQRETAPAVAGSWPQWRGPSRDGVIRAELPAQWPDSLTRRWELAVGGGHSSPVIAGNRVVVLSRQDEREIVRAVDLMSGKEIWRAEYPAPYRVNPAAQAHGPGPKSTPAIVNGRVFTLGIGGVLSAFNLATGKLVWRVPAPTVLPEYGSATSPLIEGTSVIVHVGGKDSGALTAFDAATGKPRWQWKGDGPGYGSPIIATFGGIRQVVAQTQTQLVSVNVKDGTLLWQLPFTTSFNQNSITPVVFNDLLIHTGLDRPLTAIRPKPTATAWMTETVWANPQAPMFMSSPTLVGGTVYGLSQRNRGQLIAVDAATGKTMWTTQGRDGDNASLLGSRDWLMAATTGGNLIVARMNPQKFDEVRRYQVASSAMWAHPAIAGRSIVVKDVDKLICWGF